MKKLTFKLAIMIMLILITSITLGTFMVNSSKVKAEAPLKEKYYMSIRIERGDTLWSIAEEYCTDQASIGTYINEIKKTNGIKSDRIHAGNYLTVYYYDE